MVVPRKLGDKHVLNVSNILNEKLMGSLDGNSGNLANETVSFILENIVDINEVSAIVNKFNKKDSDFHSDLEFILKDGTSKKVNLFLIKKGGQIQVKNPGAKSIFSKYFLSDELQEDFNSYFNTQYREFLLALLNYGEETNYYDFSTKELKGIVKNKYPSFNNEINPIREKFLNSLREYSYELLKGKFNDNEDNGIKFAFKKLLLLDDINIITQYDSKNKNVCSGVEFFNIDIDSSEQVEIFKKGQNKVGIKIGSVGLGIRFKFESSPTSSIKLTSSKETFNHIENKRKFNLNQVKKFMNLYNNHVKSEVTSNVSNAIGKCHESIFYFKLLKDNLSVNQVDEKVFINMFTKYSPSISDSQLNQIFISVDESIKHLVAYLEKKFKSYRLVSIQLVPDSYISDPLDSSDMKIDLMINGRYETVGLSLKAIKKEKNSTTIKNVGMGTILGPQYFQVGDLSDQIKEVKEDYNANKITRTESLERMSKLVGEALEHASQNNLTKGIQSMIGDCTLVFTFYESGSGLVLENDKVSGKVTLLRETPSKIQNTLQWNNGSKGLLLRVKFSRGEKHGWSTLKLACDFKFEL